MDWERVIDVLAAADPGDGWTYTWRVNKRRWRRLRLANKDSVINRVSSEILHRMANRGASA